MLDLVMWTRDGAATLQSDVELFHDQNKTEYARIPYAIDAIDGISESSISQKSFFKIEYNPEEAPETLKNCVNCVIASRETVRLKEEKFKTFLAHLLYEAEGKLLNKESISQVILLLKYDAAHGKCYKLFNRVAPDPSGDGSIWLDIADEQNRSYVKLMSLFFKKLLKKLRRILIILGFEKEEDQSCLKIKQLI